MYNYAKVLELIYGVIMRHDGFVQKHNEFIQKFLDFIVDREETEDSIVEFKTLLQQIKNSRGTYHDAKLQDGTLVKVNYAGLAACYGKSEFLQAIVDEMSHQLWQHLSYPDADGLILKTPLEIAIEHKNVEMVQNIAERFSIAAMNNANYMVLTERRNLGWYLEYANKRGESFVAVIRSGALESIEKEFDSMMISEYKDANLFRQLIKSLPAELPKGDNRIHRISLFGEDAKNFAGITADYGKLEFLKVIAELMPEQLWRYCQRVNGDIKIMKSALEVAINNGNLEIAKWLLSHADMKQLMENANKEFSEKGVRDLEWYLRVTEIKEGALRKSVEVAQKHLRGEEIEGEEAPILENIQSGLENREDATLKCFLESAQKKQKTLLEVIKVIQSLLPLSRKTDGAIFAVTMTSANLLLAQLGVCNRYTALAAFVGSGVATYCGHSAIVNSKKVSETPMALEGRVRLGCYTGVALCLSVGVLLHRDGVVDIIKGMQSSCVEYLGRA